MKCHHCGAGNREGARYCRECGARLGPACATCGRTMPPGAFFCDECGGRVDEAAGAGAPAADGEKKQVTVLFSDLSGYASLLDRSDPEEVKDLMTRIFGEISQVVAHHEGFIEKFIGDAVVAVFGVPRVREDDPVRAVRTALDIHDVVGRAGERLGKRLTMHTGINTGDVVAGEADADRGRHGLSGETLAVASRLADLAAPGEILAGGTTVSRTERYFRYAARGQQQVKGITRPVQVSSVVGAKREPASTQRVTGLRSPLVGRGSELGALHEAFDSMRSGAGCVIAVRGEAGVGKSRLVEEFKTSLDLSSVQWVEGHAYEYSHGAPYYPLIDLLTRQWGIGEGDGPGLVREKIRRGLGVLPGDAGEKIELLARLFGVGEDESEGVLPERWRLDLARVAGELILAWGRRAPTVVFLNDLHWADPSSIELFRSLLAPGDSHSLFVVTHRPTLDFEPAAAGENGGGFVRIDLGDLTAGETERMAASLLEAGAVPESLLRILRSKFAGNPFYVEEGVNFLVETGRLILDGGRWALVETADEALVPPTVQGVISARVDHLDEHAKRALQEAAVVGRTFPHSLLAAVSSLDDRLDACLKELVSLDLIRASGPEPDVEYRFKHDLIRDVVYQSLLRRDRQEIHERAGQVVEELFRDRLPEFFETLALHFSRGRSAGKAVDYYIKSGEKSARRYAAEEAHRHFSDAFGILREHMAPGQEGLLVDLLVRWAFVFHHRGDFKGLSELFAAWEPVARSLNDQALLGRFCTLYGLALYQMERSIEALRYLEEALRIGEETGDRWVQGYASSWLAWALCEPGRFDEALRHGERAKATALEMEQEEFLFFNSVGGIGLAHYLRGDVEAAYAAGVELLDYGRRHFSRRSLVLGHFVVACSHLTAGHFGQAIESGRQAVAISGDPWFSQFPKVILCIALLAQERFDDARVPLEEVLASYQRFGSGTVGEISRGLLGIVEVASGRLKSGFALLDATLDGFRAKERRYMYAAGLHFRGRIFSRMATGAPLRLSHLRSLGFIARTLPGASRRAEEQLREAIALAESIGAASVSGPARLDLGLHLAAKRRGVEARREIEAALGVFERCGAGGYVQLARAALLRLPG